MFNLLTATARWSCCFVPKQSGLSEFWNQSSIICLLCYDFGRKDINAINFRKSDIDALLSEFHSRSKTPSQLPVWCNLGAEKFVVFKFTYEEI